MGIGAFQPIHLLLILVVVMIVFGAGKLSEVGGALGQSVREFKHSIAEEGDQDEATASETTAESQPASAAARGTLPVTPEPPALRREEV